jgi:hypothetical protein
VKLVPWSPRCRLSCIHFFTHELFGGGVGRSADGHVGGGGAADVVDVSGNTEVRQQHSLLVLIVIQVREHDVGPPTA